MKNLIIAIAVIIFLPASLVSQNDNIKDLFMSYENVSDFKLIVATSDSDIALGLDSDVEELFNNINNIYVLKYRGADLKSSELAKFQNNFKNLIKEDTFKPMIEIDGDGVLKIFLKRNGNDDPSEVILIEEDENTAMYLWATK